MKLIDFLNRLREAKIHFLLASYRPEAIMVRISVPGERWEVEFVTDGTVEVERFRSTGEITGCHELETLFKDYTDN